MRSGLISRLQATTLSALQRKMRTRSPGSLAEIVRCCCATAAAVHPCGRVRPENGRAMVGFFRVTRPQKNEALKEPFPAMVGLVGFYRN